MKSVLRKTYTLASPGAGAPQAETGKALGTILCEAGKLSSDQVAEVVACQERLSLSFGEAAVSLGFVDREDLKFALARQFDYSYVPPGDGSLARELLAASQPAHATVEQLRRLRTQIVLRWQQTEGVAARQSVAITSAGRREGRSFVAANLAVLFSQLGKRTLLIDADLRHPRQHELFALPVNSGLSSILSRRAGLDTLKRIQVLPDLSVLPAGPLPPNPQELLGRSEFEALVTDVSSLYDVVILDTPAWSDGSDLQVICSSAGTAVTVIGAGRTTVAQGHSLVQALLDTNTSIVGAVFNRHGA